MNRKLLSFLFVVAFIFTIAIITAPPRQGENALLIDSLKRRAYKAERERDRARDSAKQFSILADTWYNLAQSKQKDRVVIRTVYNNEKKHIDSLSDRGLDSAFRAIYPDK